MIRVELFGVKEFKEKFSSSSLNAKLSPVLAEAAEKLHSSLKRSISQVYFAPYSLDKVREQTRIGTVRSNRDTLSFDLIYRSEPIPLEKFPFELKKSDQISTFRKKGTRNLVTGKFSTEVSFKVMKKGSYKIPRGVPGSQKAFFWATYDMLARKQTLGTFVRLQKATWTILDQRRAPMKRLYGPSLSSMARTRFKSGPIEGEISSFIQKRIIEVLNG